MDHMKNKQYKLIKEYPGSPKLGTIVERKGDGYYYPTNSPGGWFNENIHIIPFSEFWKEVDKKEYEILSFKGLDTIYHLKDNGKYSSAVNGTGTFTDEECLEVFKNSIHSIKRLSDGEIFTVGDKIIGFTGDDGYIIKYIRINRGYKYSNDILFANYPENGTGSRSTFLQSANKILKKPLFTTEDGIEIYEGDNYYEVITPNFHNKTCIWNILPYTARKNIIYDQEGNRKHGRLWFSTKPAAKNYIKCNKNCLNYKEVLEAFDNFYNNIYNNRDTFKENIQSIVKSKLNDL